MTSHKPRSLNILYTDFANFAIAESCQDFGVFHIMDYVALTRLKEPCVYIRKQMRDQFLSFGVEPADFEKSRLTECWGEDLFLVQ